MFSPCKFPSILYTLHRRGFYLPFYGPVSVMKFLFFLSSLNPLSLMKSTRLFRNLIFLFSLLGLGSFAWGERFEVLTSSGTAFSEYLEFSENEECEIFAFQSQTYTSNSNYGAEMHYTNANGTEQLLYEIRGMNFVSMPAEAKFSIIGPGKIRIKQLSNNSNYYSRALFNIRTLERASTTAKYATVIPENAKTNVSVILEQSTDLVSWTAANPGEFTPSTSKRFFRVRTAKIPVAITGASNAAPIVITSAGHGLSTGDAISVSGVAGNTAANGVFTITKVDDNSFSLNGTTGNAAYTSGGTWLPSP